MVEWKLPKSPTFKTTAVHAHPCSMIAGRNMRRRPAVCEESMKKRPNRFDIYLKAIAADRDARNRKDKKNPVTVEFPDGRLIVFDSVDVLHTLLKITEIDELSNIDSDEISDMAAKVKGKMKGGKINRRDKHFGLPRTDPFWEWWHLHSKANYGGRDIQSKSELAGHLATYNKEVFNLFTQSLVRIAINKLNSKRRDFAKRVLKLYFNIFLSGIR
jgi:hypothetical protein